MFEIVALVCLVSAPETCREQLVPGLETLTLAECEQRLSKVARQDISAAVPRATVQQTECRPVGSGLDLREIAPGIHVHIGAIEDPDSSNRGDVANIGVIVGDTSIAVVDTGGSRAVGEDLYRAIRELSQLPISHVILTHIHPDHVLGASVFADTGAKVVAHPGFNRAFRDRQESYETGFGQLIGQSGFLGTRPVLASEAPGTIDLGGRILEMTSWPTSHSTTDLTVLDRRTATLFAGDLVFDRHVPALDGSLTGWLSVLDQLADLGALRIVPGHGGPILSVEAALAPMRQYLETLAQDARLALEKGERIGAAVNHIGGSEANNWDLFDSYNTRNATTAFTELEWE
ncbi:quinoprotein relay system zinc metallohydrolase 2 [Rhodobacterales bacterium]|nr:quinoprotein relay system zinc metallohydrolase 2 [Rhodobacterales bacterium]